MTGPLLGFDEASRVTRMTEGEFTAEVPEAWSQGRTAFGGLGAAFGVRAIESLVECAGLPLRTVDAAFIAPVPPGPVYVRAAVLRQGRNLTHAAADVSLQPDGPPATRVHVVLGHLRPSDARVVAPAPPVTPVQDCVAFPYIAGLTPDFTQNFEFRYATGFPFSGGSEARVSGWCRFRTPERGAAALVALVDAWPGTILTMLSTPAPASTVRWSVHVPDDEPFVGDEWFWYTSEVASAEGGYSTMTAQLWRDGRLVSWSEQLLAVFDQR